MSSLAKKTIPRRLSTRQTVSLSPQDEKMLKRTFEYMAGYVRRATLEQQLQQRRALLEELNGTIKGGTEEKKEKNAKGGANKGDGRSEADRRMDEFYKCKDEVAVLEKQTKDHVSMVHTICIKDIDAISKKLGVTFTKKQIEQMIWEIDEKLDGVICFDEFVLAYYRNVFDTSGNEPSSVFHLMEFLIFDESGKGYIIEDDCMEILFARYGSSKLERELESIFGDRLRAKGGDGTLNFSGYLQSMERKLGKRAQLF